MKTSEKILCIIIVLSLFATMFYVATLLNNGNPGLHFN